MLDQKFRHGWYLLNRECGCRGIVWLCVRPVPRLVASVARPVHLWMVIGRSQMLFEKFGNLLAKQNLSAGALTGYLSYLGALGT